MAENNYSTIAMFLEKLSDDEKAYALQVLQPAMQAAEDKKGRTARLMAHDAKMASSKDFMDRFPNAGRLK